MSRIPRHDSTKLQTDVPIIFLASGGIITPKRITNITKKYHEPWDLQGFDEMRPEDQAQIITAYQTGSVADKDTLKSEDKEQYEKCVGRLKSSHVPTDRSDVREPESRLQL